MPKWITNARPNQPVTGVAAASLQSRLKQVRRYLPRAARRAEQDTEHIHQLRVWTRRAAAALEIFQPFLPKRRAKWMRSQLKRIRKAAGDARDLDVLLDRLEHWSNPPGDLAPLICDVRRRRQAAQPAVVEVDRELGERDLLKRRCRQLLKRVRIRQESSQEAACYGAWSDRQLAAVIDPFFDAAAADLSDLENLHALRIAGKQLRYTMELVAGAYPGRFRKKLYGEISALQEKLGAINDHRVAQARFLTWSEETPDEYFSQLLRELASAEKELLVQERTAFFAWWTPQRSAGLRIAFDEMLALRPENRA
jgi:CHAD domain-containing protein